MTSEPRDETMDSSTDSDIYIEDDENQSLLSGPMMPLLAVASVAEMQAEADMDAIAVAVSFYLPNKSFSYFQVGFPGSAHDSRVLKSTSLYKSIQNGDPNYFPSPQYHIVGDSAFGVQKHLIVPFKNSGNLSQTQILFNNKLSKARVNIENAFGFLKGRFRRLKHVEADIARIPKIIKACCVLHNISITQPD